MPTSWYQTIPIIIDKVVAESPESILDIGIGFGKYGVLFREALDIPFQRYDKSKWLIKIEGIEAFEGYKNLIHEYVYDKIYYDTVEHVLPTLGNYDVITLIDVLEHFDKEQGRKILNELLAHTNKSLIISTPVSPAEQEEYNGNHFEAHKSKWAVTDFANFETDFCFIEIGDNRALIVKLYPTIKLKEKNSGILLKDHLLLQSEAQAENFSRSLDGCIVNNKLKIAYVLPHKNLTGGLKMLIEQIKWLKSRGHTVDIYLKTDSETTSALPDWNKIAADRDVVIPINEPFDHYIKGYDVIVAGWFSLLPELIKCDSPVMYWEQGSEWFFGDFKNSPITLKCRQMMNTIYSLPCVLSSVSNFVADVFQNRYGRKTAVIPNGIDTDIFYPTEPPDENCILLVGNPALTFKGFDDALRALDLLWKSGYKFKVNWICQMKPSVSGIGFPLHFIVNPSQKDLPEYYRQADIALFTSWYEGFGMPPLEAMACGVPAICTRCGGTDMYIRPSENALVVPACDIGGMAAAAAFLLEDKKARKALSVNGRKTALDFSSENSLSKLEDLLYKIKTFYKP
jgi:glycosyltransferase involved in cell wall biosynthesis